MNGLCRRFGGFVGLSELCCKVVSTQIGCAVVLTSGLSFE
jgi:hypothetical protein